MKNRTWRKESRCSRMNSVLPSKPISIVDGPKGEYGWGEVDLAEEGISISSQRQV
jgi:hypothetical protein